MKNLQIQLTKDGSHTLFVPGMAESYHSHHGAVTESKHVFIDHGLDYYHRQHSPRELNVLEIGFGTGLNALLACHYSQVQKQRVKYTALEPHPLSWELVSKLNYPDYIQHGQGKFWYSELHRIGWGQIEWLNPYFSILKKKEPIQDHITPERYDVCFFDAFAPSKQSEVWDIKVLEVVRRCLNINGILVSYCAQGQFKRDLRALGFEVESLPGPPGKKEMTRAVFPG